MSDDSSVVVFLRMVDERLQSFKDHWHDLFAVLPLEDREAKLKSARVTLTAAEHLKGALSSQDYPTWLVPVIKELKYYVTTTHDKSAGSRLLTKLTLRAEAILNYK